MSRLQRDHILATVDQWPPISLFVWRIPTTSVQPQTAPFFRQGQRATAHSVHFRHGWAMVGNTLGEFDIDAGPVNELSASTLLTGRFDHHPEYMFVLSQCNKRGKSSNKQGLSGKEKVWPCFAGPRRFRRSVSIWQFSSTVMFLVTS